MTLAATAPATRTKTIVAPPHYDQALQRQYESHRASGATSPEDKIRVLKCRVPIGHGYDIVAYSSEKRPDVVFVDAIHTFVERWGPRERNGHWYMLWGTVVEEVAPFISVEVIGTPYTREIEVPSHGGWMGYAAGRPVLTKKVVASYNGGWQTGRDIPGIPYLHAKVRVTLLDGSGSDEVEFRFERPESGEVDLSKPTHPTQNVAASCMFFGLPLSWEVDILHYHDLHRVLSHFTCKQGSDALWARWFNIRKVDPATRDLAGVKALETRKDIKPNLDRLATEEPLLWRFFAWLHDGKTRDKTSNNKLIAAMLEAVGTDYDKLRAELRRALDNVPKTESVPEYGGAQKDPIARNVCLSLLGATDKVAEQKAKQQWQFAKGARAQAEVLGISADRHPLLMARVEAGDISLNLFHEAGNEDRLINVEFDLWERALAREGWADVLVEIAQNASKRTTYSKRVTSYIAFPFRIERYLDRHAPRKKGHGWKAMPKFVQSQWELEMGEATEEGTTKRRSAFTPVADNDEGTVTVPYVAMAISGVRTTWCYSERYFVVEEGQEDPIFDQGGVYEADLAEKLNGRDDYGLCFFTLTGTDRNTGYPTFLVIFERTTHHGTRVHFHRVHPSRSRGPNGTQTPPNRLIEECYRYMAGNVRAEEIAHQQGDILLIKADGPGKATSDPVPVFGFENHAFVPLDAPDGSCPPVRLMRAKAKSRDNLLGWIHAPNGMRMPHPEHESIEDIAPGWYEVRRCKSWEANPTSVWVLNID